MSWKGVIQCLESWQGVIQCRESKTVSGILLKGQMFQQTFFWRTRLPQKGHGFDQNWVGKLHLIFITLAHNEVRFLKRKKVLQWWTQFGFNNKSRSVFFKIITLLSTLSQLQWSKKGASVDKSDWLQHWKLYLTFKTLAQLQWYMYLKMQNKSCFITYSKLIVCYGRLHNNNKNSI